MAVEPDDWLNSPLSSEPGELHRHVEIDSILRSRARWRWAWTWAKGIPMGIGIAVGLWQVAVFVAEITK